MTSHADTLIRPTIRHDKMRVLDTWEHPTHCHGCAADRALDALLAENQRLREVADAVLNDEGASSLLEAMAREALAGDAE